MKTLTKISVLLLAATALYSCTGQPKLNRPFSHQPIHPNMNMDQQNRFEVQEENRFFADSSANRLPVEGTVARGHLKADKALYKGLNEDGTYVKTNPYPITKEFLYHGKDRYEVFCTPCHGGIGDGNGIVMVGKYGYVPAPSYHIDRLREAPDGELYSAIANGIRNMPSYASQMPKVEDRWAIVAYIRALQKSQYATKEELDAKGVDLSALEADFDKAQAKAEALAAASAGNDEVSAERGKEIVTQNACGACHSVDGSTGVGPTWKGAWGTERELEDGSKVVMDEAYVAESITKPNAKVVKGFAGVMVPYPLSESEIQSVVEYIKTLK